MNTKRLTKKAIDKAIAHTNLSLTYTPGDGVFYFIDRTTGYPVGETVYVARMNHLTLDQWVANAEYALAQSKNEGLLNYSWTYKA